MQPLGKVDRQLADGSHKAVVGTMSSTVGPGSASSSGAHGQIPTNRESIFARPCIGQWVSGLRRSATARGTRSDRCRLRARLASCRCSSRSATASPTGRRVRDHRPTVHDERREGCARALANGAFAFIPQPVNLAELDEALKKAEPSGEAASRAEGPAGDACRAPYSSRCSLRSATGSPTRPESTS